MSQAVPPEKSVNPALANLSGQSGAGSWLAIFNQQESVLVIAFLLGLGGVTMMNRGFIAPTNLVDILYNSSYIGVAAVGMTMIILCGHIDISIGAAPGLCATVAGQLAVAHQSMYLVVPITILTGGVIGLIHGGLVEYGR